MEEGSTSELWRDVPTLLAAAHELKAPLTLIRQLALQLEDEYDRHDPAAMRIRLTAERSLALVEGLTRAARLEDALCELEPIDVGELYDSVAHELTPLSRALNQSIEVQVPHTAVVIGDRSLLRSVLIGLCDNALAHNAADRPVVLTARHRGRERLTVGVRDYGPHTSELKEVRRRLGRSPQAMNARPRSSGLGLLIADQFARRMDGALSMVRHREAGVTFSLDLPKSRQISLLEYL